MNKGYDGKLVIYELLTEIHQLLANNIIEYEKLTREDQNIILACFANIIKKV